MSDEALYGNDRRITVKKNHELIDFLREHGRPDLADYVGFRSIRIAYYRRKIERLEKEGLFLSEADS